MSETKQGIAWKESYSLGNEQIDLQHKKLFELVDGLVNDCIDGIDAVKLQETLTFLANYTVRHFHFEEELQKQYEFPEYESHKQLHEDFKVTVGELMDRFKQNGSSTELSSDVNRIVVRWLVNHILREDKKIGVHIRNKTEEQ
jgi:hemerythrin